MGRRQTKKLKKIIMLSTNTYIIAIVEMTAALLFVQFVAADLLCLFRTDEYDFFQSCEYLCAPMSVNTVDDGSFDRILTTRYHFILEDYYNLI